MVGADVEQKLPGIGVARSDERRDWRSRRIRASCRSRPAWLVRAPTSFWKARRGPKTSRTPATATSSPNWAGLHIIGSERHESRRIDNQLRGRAGRQGDPGSSRFYISLDDELWRLFGTRGQFLLKSWDEDEPVEAGIISKQIERAQKKVELNHFEGRKHVLQYDDVMNVQREVIYRERRRALQGADIRDTVVDMAQKAAITPRQTRTRRAPCAAKNGTRASSIWAWANCSA